MAFFGRRSRTWGRVDISALFLCDKVWFRGVVSPASQLSDDVACFGADDGVWFGDLDLDGAAFTGLAFLFRVVAYRVLPPQLFGDAGEGCFEILDIAGLEDAPAAARGKLFEIEFALGVFGGTLAAANALEHARVNRYVAGLARTQAS